MKKAICVTAVCLIALFLSGIAIAQHGWFFSLANTTWKGDLTVINVDGSTAVITGSTLIFATQTGDFITGTISEPAIAFSAIKEDFERSIHMTAANFKVTAEIVRGFRFRHHWNQSPDSMSIVGSNFADGSMFTGTLTRQ